MVIKVCICGGGNGSQVTAGYLGAKKDYEVRVLTRQPQRWIDGMKEKGGYTVHSRVCGDEKVKTIVGKIAKVSSDPKDVATDADLIICGGPSHANPIYLQSIAPYVKKGAIVGGGFDWAAKNALGEKFKDVTVFALQHIPWICRANVYGKEATMMGPKKLLLVTCIPISKGKEIADLCTKLFDIPTKVLPNFMCITLTPSNQIIHPARYYGIFKDWDGKKVYDPKKIPTLYSDLDDFSANELQTLNLELQEIKKALEKKYPKLDLSSVKDLGQRIIEQYGEEVKDRSSLRAIFSSNLGYAGCKTPVKQVEGGVIPDVNSRLFVEDIPFGLCILKNLADLLGVDVPKINFLIKWHQQFMGKEYLTEDNKLNPKLIHETGAPARYGFTNLDDLVADYLTSE